MHAGRAALPPLSAAAANRLILPFPLPAISCAVCATRPAEPTVWRCWQRRGAGKDFSGLDVTGICCRCTYQSPANPSGTLLLPCQPAPTKIFIFNLAKEVVSADLHPLFAPFSSLQYATVALGKKVRVGAWENRGQCRQNGCGCCRRRSGQYSVEALHSLPCLLCCVVPACLHVQGTSRRFGFVLFGDHADAEAAMKQVDGLVLKASSWPWHMCTGIPNSERRLGGYITYLAPSLIR